MEDRCSGRSDDGDLQTWVEIRANQMVGSLFGEAGEQRDISEMLFGSDAQFAEAVVNYELALLADECDPLRVRLRMAVLWAVRDALAARRAIRRLPETQMEPCGAVDLKRKHRRHQLGQGDG
jgi:hypothetical protein